MDYLPLISRKRHYFYVLVFSIAVWLFAAMLVGGFFPYYVKSGFCECGYHRIYQNISYILFGIGGLVCGLIFSLPLHRWGLVSISNPHDSKVNYSWIAKNGKAFLGWRGLIFFSFLPLLFISTNHITSTVIQIHPTKMEMIEDNITELICASRRGDIETVRQEIYSGADINAKDWKGRTALHAAAQFGSTEIAQLLVENGADIDAETISVGNYTPLTVAVNYENIEVVKLLIQYGSDINNSKRNRGYPLYSAIASGNLEIAKLLIENGADLNFEMAGCWKLLHIAVDYNRYEIAGLLIDKGLDVNAKSFNGSTPLDQAMGESTLATPDEQQKIISLLRAHGAKTGEELRKEAGE